MHDAARQVVITAMVLLNGPRMPANDNAIITPEDPAPEDSTTADGRDGSHVDWYSYDITLLNDGWQVTKPIYRRKPRAQTYPVIL